MGETSVRVGEETAQFFKIDLETASECPKQEYTVAPVALKARPIYAFCKRALDLAVALVVGLIAILPMLLLALIIRLDSKGPALFKQERLGKDGKPFMIYKFRSMYEDAEKDGPKWAQEEDDRCTRVGRLMRKTRLDELPQLWNILVGQMSLVGPRPERPVFYKEFETYIHGFSHRLVVKPGLTGLAQVNGGYDLLPEEKILWDMKYIENRSMWLDFKCMFKTVHLVFTHKGAR